MDQPISQSTRAGNQLRFRPKVKTPKWYLAYFLLAAFDLLTISGSLYLNHTIMEIFSSSVNVNGEWAGRLGELAKLAQLAGSVNAPGNDVFDTRDVPGESSRLQNAIIVFTAQFEAMEGELKANLPPEKVQSLLPQLDVVNARMENMVQEAQLIFSYFDSGESDKAGERMATMDRKYFQVNAALANVGTSFRSLQGIGLTNQEVTAESF